MTGIMEQLNKTKINYKDNFCRVFELPDTYPEGFCFGGGKPIIITMVDWFYPIPNEEFYPNKDEITLLDFYEEFQEKLIEFIKTKKYIKKDRKYLVITNFNHSFIVEP